MSSSMFIECNSINKTSSVDHQDSNSNLIVVYGKNGISFDEQGLKNVIDEKKISSISVIRLTSPTPSMKDEEEEVEKLEELRQQELHTEDGSSLEDLNFLKFAKVDGKLNSEADDSLIQGDLLDKLSNTETDFLDSDDDDEDDENRLYENKNCLRKTVRHRGRIQNIAKQSNLRCKNSKRKEKDVVGIHVEEFYSSDRANQIIDEALKMAGLNAQQNKDYRFQLLVIQNDHCYTPFTSPSQMKAKLESNRLEAEKQTFRKMGVCVSNLTKSTTSVDNKLENLKLPAKMYPPAKVGINRTLSFKFKKDQKISKSANETNRKGNRDYLLDRNHDDDVDNIKHISMPETLDYGNNSAADSSLECGRKTYDVSYEANRIGDQANKTTKRLCTVRLLQNPKNPFITSQRNEISAKDGCSRNLITVFNHSQKENPKLKSKNIPHIKLKTTPAKFYLNGPSTLPPTINSLNKSNAIDLPSNHTKINFTENSKIIKNESTSKLCKTIISPTTVTIKEIEVNANKQEQSLTNLKTTIKQERSDKTSTCITVDKIAKEAMMMPNPPKAKNLYNDVVSSTVQNNKLEHSVYSQNAGHDDDELTDQIALHSNTDSYILAAENDKQLDLINAIVEDEMQNDNKHEIKQEISEINKDIPVLVRMLENTVNSLQNKSNMALESVGGEVNDISTCMIKKISYNNENVDDDKLCPSLSSGLANDLQIIDENLLTATEDDLPDDILQQVVELIKVEDEQQSFEEAANAANNAEFILQDTLSNNDMSISQSINDAEQQMTGKLFNSNSITVVNDLPAPAITAPTTINDVNKRISNYDSQIIRGNGRIVSLPPLAAPTTRAKRRLAELETNDKTLTKTTYSVLTESNDDIMQANSSICLTTPAITTTNTSNTTPVTRRVTSKDVSNVASTKGVRKVLNRKPRKKLQINRKYLASEQSTNSESNLDENDNDEDDDDDPNKLWCICRQPHNNRFMICCDVCGDWFHGTCVTVTKAMGLEMEQKGIDWTCPNCLKKQEEKKQPKISDMLSKKMPAIDITTTKAISSKAAAITTTTPIATTAATSTATVSYDSIKSCKVKRNQVESNSLHVNSNIKDNKTSQDTVITNSKTTQKKSITTAAKQILNTGVTLTSKRTATNLLRQQTSNNTNNSSGNNKSKISKIIQLTIPCTTNTTITTTTTTAAATITARDSTTKCIVCKRNARENSIYCSDDCIRKHAQNALNALLAKSNHENDFQPIMKTVYKNDDTNSRKKGKGLFEDLLLMADRKPKVERVNVLERKSGRILTGINAPTTTNLKRWLQENPTFEVLPTSTATYHLNLERSAEKPIVHNTSSTIRNAPFIQRNVIGGIENANSAKGMLTTNSLNFQKSNTIKITPTIAESDRNTLSSSAATSQSAIIQIQKSQKIEKTCDSAKNLKEKLAKRNANNTDGHISSLQASPKVITTTAATPVPTNPTASTTATTNSEQPVRLNVQRTLKDHLLQRIQVETADCKDPAVSMKLTVDEVEQFAKNLELEMFNYFCRDTGSKYRAKYRSLIFNIKDRKNKTLYAKICSKLITPKQLVHMTPEEMASQELAQWRENETKHQLEIIKKSELDLLHFNKSYLLKTHKGEEIVIEDPTVAPNPLEVITLNNSLTNNSNSNAVVTDECRRNSTKDCDNISKVTTAITTQGNYKHLEEYKTSKEYSAASTEHHLSCEDNEKIVDERKVVAPTSVEKSSARAEVTADSTGNGQQSSSASSSGSNSKYKHKKSGRHHKERRQKSVERFHHKWHSRKRSRSSSHSRSRSPEYAKRYKSLHSKHRPHHYHHHHHRHHQHQHQNHNQHRRKSEPKYDKTRQKEIDLNNLVKHSNKTVLGANIDANLAFARKEQQQQRQMQKQIQHKSPKSLEAFNLIDQILESTKTVEEAANLVIDKDRDNVRRDYSNSISSSAAGIHTQQSTHSTHTNKPRLSIHENEMENTSSNSSPSAFSPSDPYQCYNPADNNIANIKALESNTNLWSGNLNMIDVASFQITLQPILGNYANLSKCLPAELDVVGRINPDTVWDYISKIKKSPNKEIVIIRIIPSNAAEIIPYTTLYRYLENRHRLGVIKTTSSHIKDFYIHPLGAGKKMPSVIRTNDQLDIFHDSNRPDLLIGIIIRIVSKRSMFANTLLNRSHDNDFNNSPNTNSPKYFKKRRHSIVHNVNEIDVDAIIKAPIISKNTRTEFTSSALPVVTPPNANDADEPYSPGGSTDDDDLSLPIMKLPQSKDANKSDDDELKRKMEEINRQIAAQELEIAGLLTGDTTSFATSTNTSNVLANISIPSNLSQILASIRPSSSSTAFNEAESIAAATSPSAPLVGAMHSQNPAAIGRFHTNYQSNINDLSATTISITTTATITTPTTTSGSTSRLAQLSEEELLRLVPDDIILNKSLTQDQYCGEPPPPGV